jgi:hypothetical protein
MLKILFKSRFSWIDVLLMFSAYPLSTTIGWWTIPVLFVCAAWSALISVKLGVE